MGKLDELKEIVALSKESGITLSEAISLYREYQQAHSGGNEPAPKEEEQPKKTEEQDTGKEQPEGAPNNEQPPEAEGSVIDYKKRAEELEQKISDLQKENVRKDVSGQDTRKSDEEIVNSLTASFM